MAGKNHKLWTWISKEVWHLIYGYCRATTSKQIELGYLEEQEDLIKERYYESIIFKESSLDMNMKKDYKFIESRRHTSGYSIR